MNQPNFAPLLDKPSAEIEKPKPVPQGSYLCVVQGLPKMDKSTKKQTEYVEFTLKPLQALEDVDANSLEEMGGIADKTFRATYYVTENSIWRLKEFLDHCGVEEGEDSLRQRIEGATGCQVIAVVKHEASQDGTSVFAKVATTAAAE